MVKVEVMGVVSVEGSLQAQPTNIYVHKNYGHLYSSCACKQLVRGDENYTDHCAADGSRICKTCWSNQSNEYQPVISSVSVSVD